MRPTGHATSRPTPTLPTIEHLADPFRTNIASCSVTGRKLWMVVYPARHTIHFEVSVDNNHRGSAVSLMDALAIYNNLAM